MNYLNAHQGLKKIRSAVVLELVGMLCFAVLAIVVMIASKSEQAASESFQGTIGTVVIVLGLAALILSLISFFRQISGLRLARQDEPDYQKALNTIYVTIIVSLVSGVLEQVMPNNSIISDLSSIIAILCEILLIVYICKATDNLMISLGYSNLNDMGKKVSTIVAVSYLVSSVAQILPTILGRGSMDFLTGVFSFAGSALKVYGTVMYLQFLKESVLVLEK